MEKITYGVPGLVDWVAQIKAGAATVKVHFIGGALTSYGVTPAEYTTANPFIQKVIEQSSHFKSGRIIELRRVTIADAAKPANIAKSKPKKVAAQPAPQPQNTVAAPEVPADTQQTEAPAAETAAPSHEPTQVAEEATEETTTEETADGLMQIAVSCVQDAQAYLQENFNIPSYKIRTRPSAQRAAAEHGVMFVGGGFVAVGSEEAEDDTAEEE